VDCLGRCTLLGGGDLNAGGRLLNVNGLGVRNTRVLERMEIRQVARLLGEHRALRDALDDVRVLLANEEPLEILRHVEGLAAGVDGSRIPDVILVKKSYPARRRKHRHRNWRLKSIVKEAEEEVGGRGAVGRRGGLDQERVERDYESFLRDLEEDPEFRATINIYKDDKKKDEMEVDSAGAMADTEETDREEDEADFPEVQADELLEALDDLTLDDKQVEP